MFAMSKPIAKRRQVVEEFLDAHRNMFIKRFRNAKGVSVTLPIDKQHALWNECAEDIVRHLESLDCKSHTRVIKVGDSLLRYFYVEISPESKLFPGLIHCGRFSRKRDAHGRESFNIVVTENTRAWRQAFYASRDVSCGSNGKGGMVPGPEPKAKGKKPEVDVCCARFGIFR